MQQAPEEVKDKVAVKHGYENWDDLYFKLANARYYKDRGEFLDIETEVMREYLEVLYADRVENAASELPTAESFYDDYCRNNKIDLWIEEDKKAWCMGADWMKEAASLVIAKLKGMYDELIKQNDLLQEYIQEKDKTIDYLQKKIEFLSINKHNHQQLKP